METNGWIPGYTRGTGRGSAARVVVTDESRLLLPGYGAGCVSPVGISDR